jgi:protein involved in ribonucleotide reduction
MLGKPKTNWGAFYAIDSAKYASRYLAVLVYRFNCRS